MARPWSRAWARRPLGSAPCIPATCATNRSPEFSATHGVPCCSEPRSSALSRSTPFVTGPCHNLTWIPGLLRPVTVLSPAPGAAVLRRPFPAPAHQAGHAEFPLPHPDGIMRLATADPGSIAHCDGGHGRPKPPVGNACTSVVPVLVFPTEQRSQPPGHMGNNHCDGGVSLAGRPKLGKIPDFLHPGEVLVDTNRNRPACSLHGLFRSSSRQPGKRVPTSPLRNSKWSPRPPRTDMEARLARGRLPTEVAREPKTARGTAYQTGAGRKLNS